MAKSPRPPKIDPAVLLNDGPWDDFDALCRQEYQRLQEGSSARWFKLAARGGGALVPVFMGLLWLAGLSYLHSFILVYALLLVCALALWQWRYSDFKPASHLVVAAAAGLMVYAGLLVLVAAMFERAISFLGIEPLAVMLGGCYLVFLFFSTWPHAGGGYGAIVTKIATAFGWRYSFVSSKFPSGKTEHLGEVHAPRNVRDHVSGEWRGANFHAGRYQGDEERDQYLLIHCTGLRISGFCAEATSHAQFPDESEEMKGAMHVQGNFRLRLHAGQHGGREWQFLVSLLEPAQREAHGAPCYIAMDGGDVMFE